VDVGSLSQLITSSVLTFVPGSCHKTIEIRDISYVGI